MQWDWLREYFRLHPRVLRYLDLLQRTGQPPPDAVSAGPDGGAILQWHQPPRTVVMNGPAADTR